MAGLPPTLSGPTEQLTETQLQQLFDTASSYVHRSRGSGDPNSLYSTVLSQHDRFGANPMMSNHELVGYTFITRPKLNLSRPSLRQDPIMSMLDTMDPKSLPFAIRCYLDTNFSRRPDVKPTAAQCPFFNEESPFIIPLCNNLVSSSGWPDPVIDTETTEGGFFSEDLTMAKGSDRLNRTYNLTLTFRDIQGGFIMALLYMWIRYMELVVRGDVIAYPEDIANRRINYTCSIYRFVMDSSRQFILKWAKATGCFPQSVPLGDLFNFGERENFITSAAQYSVPFTANTVEYWDPRIFRDFNTIAARYSPTISNIGRTENGIDFSAGTAQQVDLTPTSATQNQPFQFSLKPENNFIGLPFVNVQGGQNRLLWIANPGDTNDPYQLDWNTLKAALQSNVDTSNAATAATASTASPATTYT